MKIVTDSAADLLPEDIRANGISIAPLHIQFPDEGIDADQISPDDFYSRLRDMEPEIPTTSQPSSGRFAKIYKALAGEEILSIHISSGLSGTIEAARQSAQQEHEARITVVDTMTLSGAQRFQVLAAARLSNAGCSKETILERMKQIRAATEIAYTLDTLKYLARGGRIGRVQALAGVLLKLKPVITVDKSDGKYNSIGKGRTLRRTMEEIVDYMSGIFGSTKPVWVSVLHGQFHEQADTLAKMIGERLKVGKIEILRISPVLGVHTGPGVVGAAVVPMYLMEGME